MNAQTTSRIAWAKIRGGVYQVANGDQKTGTIRGDYRAGFWAYDVNGVKLPQTFDTIREAATVLARQHAEFVRSLRLAV